MSYRAALGTSTCPPQKCLRASAALHGGAPTQPCLPTAGLLAQGQYDLDPLPPFPDHVQYTHYSDQIGKRPACHQAFFSPTLPRCAQLSQGWGEVGPWEPQGGVPRAGGLPDPPVHIHLSFQTTRTTMIIKVKGWGQDRWTGSWVESPCRAGGGGMGRREQTPLSSPVAEVTPRPPEEQFQFQSQQQVQQEVIPAPTLGRPHAPSHPWEWGGPGPGLEREPHPALNIPLPVISAYLSPTPEPGHVETEPTEPGPLGKSLPNYWRDRRGPGS